MNPNLDEMIDTAMATCGRIDTICKRAEVRMKGIQTTTPPTANRNAVRALLSGPEPESLEFVRRHADNAAWLKLADEIEFAKTKPRKSVLAMIRTLSVSLPKGG